MEHLGIGRSTLYNIFKSENKFKKFNAEQEKRSFFNYYPLHKIQRLVFLWKIVFCTYPENTYPDIFTEKSCPTCPDKWISTVPLMYEKISTKISLNI